MAPAAFSWETGAVKGHVVRHVEDQLIAIAGHTDAGALQLLAQLGFLHVHVVADTATQRRASSNAGQDALLAVTLAGGERTYGRTGSGASQRAPGTFGGLGFTCVGVGGTAAQGNGQCQSWHQDLGSHEKTSVKTIRHHAGGRIVTRWHAIV